MSTDRIEKQVLLRAPRSRVWRAISEAEEFGAWFRVRWERPFAVGACNRGRITYPGYEHLTIVESASTGSPPRDGTRPSA